MRLIHGVTAPGLALAVAAIAFLHSGAASAREQGKTDVPGPVALKDSAEVQDVSAAVDRHRLEFSTDSSTRDRAVPQVWRGEHPWFGFKLVNPTPLPLERLLMVRRPLVAGAGWSVGTSAALPHGPAVKWVGAGAPEALPARPGTGGAELFKLALPGGANARLAVPGAEGPVIAAVLTQSAYGEYASFRFVILGLGFGLLGVLAALSVARWLGAGDRAAAASAGVGLAAIWVLATQFGHHLALTGAGTGFDPGLKAAGLLLLGGALLFSVRMQAALSDRFLDVLTWSALGCAALAVIALPGTAVTVAAGPILLAASILALAAAVTDALNHRAHLAIRLPDLVSLSVLVLVLAAAGVLAAGEPSVAADRWALGLHGVMVVALAVLGGSGLVLHHGLAVPLLSEYHPPAAEPEEPGVRPAAEASAAVREAAAPQPASGPEPAAASAASAIAAKEQRDVSAQGAPSADEGDPEIIRDLREALDRRRIEVVYQPFIGLSDGAIAGFEALARWHREGHGEVPPDTFIPLAEEAGLIDVLGTQILEQAAHKLGEWQRQNTGRKTPLRMNVNISARQLAAPELVETVRTLTQGERIPPDTLTLELTESLLVEDPDRAAARLGRLRDLGVKLALDDFGTGYSALNYLRRMPFDILKIDRSFLDDIADERGRRILRAIIDLAHDLDMTVVAEGVRQASDLEALRKLGCDAAQGPFCGPPLAAAAAEAALGRETGSRAPSQADLSS